MGSDQSGSPASRGRLRPWGSRHDKQAEEHVPHPDSLSLVQVSMRLNLPKERISGWVIDGKIEAEIRPGAGYGMDYYFTPDQVVRARELRDAEVRPAWTEEVKGEEVVTQESAVIDDEFSNPTIRQLDPGELLAPEGHEDRMQALVAMEDLRRETLLAVERQAEREASTRQMIDALDTVLTTTLKALSRAQGLRQAKLTSTLDGLRAQLADQIGQKEREEDALRAEIVRTHTELAAVLKTMSPGSQIPPLDMELFPKHTAAETVITVADNGAK